MTMSEEPIDAATLAALKESTGAEFVSELAAAFLQEAPVMLADLRDALAAGDAARFRRSAHSLKSNGNTFGALALGSMARELELGGLERARREDAPLDALAREYHRVAAALRELCGG